LLHVSGLPGQRLNRRRQILDLTVAVARLHGDAGYVEPILQAALDGLRPAGV
jgi:hypothetical protein